MNLHLLIAAAALAFSTSPLNAMDVDLPDTPDHVGATDFYEDENVESFDLSNDEENTLDENHAETPVAPSIETEDDEELDDTLESPLGDDAMILEEDTEEEDIM